MLSIRYGLCKCSKKIILYKGVFALTRYVYIIFRTYLTDIVWHIVEYQDLLTQDIWNIQISNIES